MTRVRGHNWVLFYSGLMAACVHAAAALGLYWVKSDLVVVPIQRSAESLPHPAQPIPVGQADSAVTSLNWISVEDFRELLAEKEKFDQAAVQATATPVERAPTPLDPTLPQTQTKATPESPPVTVLPPPSPPSSPTVALLRIPQSPARPRIQPTPDNEPSPTNPESPAPTPRKQSPPVQNNVDKVESPRPTSAPREDRESSPVSQTESLEVEPGKVVARHGIEINTVAPRWPVAAQYAIPNNPLVTVTFDPKTGKAIEARLIKSTGYANVDAPILASLFRWTAEGEPLKRSQEPFEMRIRLLIRPEPETKRN